MPREGKFKTRGRESRVSQRGTVVHFNQFFSSTVSQLASLLCCDLGMLLPCRCPCSRTTRNHNSASRTKLHQLVRFLPWELGHFLLYSPHPLASPIRIRLCVPISFVTTACHRMRKNCCYRSLAFSTIHKHLLPT